MFEGEENLKLLSLEGNLITKIDHLVSLNSLLYLNFYCNKITEIENLQNVVKLKALMLGKNNIEKIKNLNCLQELEVLDLHSNKIKVIENLTLLKKLRLLNLANNLITNFSELSSNKNLEELNLRKNLIVTVPNILSNFDKLRKFNIGKNMISKVEYLHEFKKLKSLTELIIEENPVLVIKESYEIVKSLPIRTKQKITAPAIPGGIINTSNFNTTIAILPKNTTNFLEISLKKEPENANGKELKDNSIGTNSSSFKPKIKLSDKLSRHNSSILSSARDSVPLTTSIQTTSKNNNLVIQPVPNLIQPNNNNYFNFISSVQGNHSTGIIPKLPPKLPINQNSVSTTAPSEHAQSQIIAGASTASTNAMDQVIKHIQQEWGLEMDYIVENGYNGYNIKRLKETKLFSGHAELEDNSKLNIYGNAIKVVNQEEFFNSIELISISYFNIDLILSKKLLEKLKKYKKLKKLTLMHNNIHSYFQLIKFEEIGNLESIEIKNNEVCSSNLLRYFLIYRFQSLRSFNCIEITNKDKLFSKKAFEYFDNCISVNEQNLSKKKQSEDDSDSANTSKIVTGLAATKQSKQLEIYCDRYKINTIKAEFYQFSLSVFDELVTELLNEE